MLLFSSVVCIYVFWFFSLLTASMSLLCFRENTVRDETVPECTVQNNSSVRNGNLKTSVSLFVCFVCRIYFVTFNC